ncbi:hypothetical protein M514_06147 [Trichuris suis]|uniref:Uncharacterized protein n=1 Tax=Trichuris suis TaxID=68888 RepID=A0A085NK32_9BILA|nr:hypothetical protein M514_06147 [Trichuris suis]
MATIRDIQIQEDSTYEHLSLEELYCCCLVEDRTVQSAISRTLSNRAEKLFWDLMLIDDGPLRMQPDDVMVIFSVIRHMTRHALRVVEDNKVLQAPTTVQYRLSIKALIIVEKAMAILENLNCYLDRIEELRELADEWNADLAYVELEQAFWLSQVEPLQEDL